MQERTHAVDAPAVENDRRSIWRAWASVREPHLVRGPFARWPRSSDAVIALVVFVGSVIAVAASSVDDGDEFRLDLIGDQPVLAFILLGVSAGALLWRRTRPVPVVGIVLAMMVVWAVAELGDGQDVALVVAAYSVGRYVVDPRVGAATVVAIVGVSIIGSFVDSTQRIDLLAAVLVPAVPWYVGARVRNRGDYVRLLQERAATLEAEQQARAGRAVAEERSRIARELHDVVAHRVSMMTVQAGAARTIARDDLDLAIDALGDVEDAGRQALGELRHLLGVLRPDGAEADQLGPQPGLRDIPDLIDALSRTGADVTLDQCAPSADPAVAVDVSAYRIVQESLTNIVKHAGPDPSVHVSIAVDGSDLTIEVTNTVSPVRLHGTGDPLPDSGFGIVGMQERAELLGGTLSSVPVAPDRHLVVARLPLHGGSS